MPLISQSITHLIGGVTQRPPMHQGAEQLLQGDNVWADARYGLLRRPPVVYQKDLTATTTGWATAFIHPHERDSNERYRVALVNGSVKVYDVDTGSEMTIRDRTGGFGYLSGATDASDFRARSIGDTIYIANRTQTPAMKTSNKAPTRPHEALVYIRRGEYSTPYAIYLDGRAFVYITPDPATAVSEGEITTEEIARQLKMILDRDLVASMLYTVQRFRSTLYIKRTFAGLLGYDPDFSISVSDGLAGEGIKAVKGEVQSIEDLPRWSKWGVVLKVVGDPDTKSDDFYVRYWPDNTPEDGGVWREAPKPGRLTRIDPTTMPHRLVRQGNLFPKTENEVYPYLEPTIAQHTDDVVTDTGFNQDETGASIPDDDVIIRTDATGVRKDIGGDGSEQDIEVRYDVDTSLVDPGADVDVVLYHVTTGDVETEIQRKSYTPGTTTLQDTQKLEQSTQFGTGEKLLVKLEYQQDVAPTSEAKQATLTIQKSTTTVVVDPLLDDTYTRPKRRWFPPLRYTKVRSISITYRTQDVFGNTLVYPTGTECKIKLQGTNTFTHTVTAGQTAAQIAAAMQVLINAHGTYTATVASNVVKVTLTAGGSFPTCISATKLPGTIFYNSKFSFTADEFVGKTLVNVSDGSSGTVTANTANTVTVGSSSGGVDNEIRPGDVCYVKEAGTWFTFESVEWDDCSAGDEFTNKEPSFIGKGINDVFFHENRLGFVSEENVIMSEVGEYGQFFRTRVSQFLDSDRIDVASASDTVGVLHSVVYWNDNLYGIADNVQYKISGHPALGPRTIRMDQVSKYPISDRVRPAVVGDRLFFAHNKETYVSVQVMSPPSEDAPDSPVHRDLCLEVPSYISGKILDIVGDADLGMVAVLADGNQKEIFLYTFLDIRGELQHEAWQKWILPAGNDVLAMEFSAGSLGLLIKRADGIYYCDMDLDISVAPGADERVAYSDMRLDGSALSPSYSGGVGTTWTLPFAVNTDQSTEGEVVVWRRDTYAQVTVTRPSTTTVRTSTDIDLSAVSVYVGIRKDMTAKLVPVYKRREDGRPERTGRMQLRYIDINYHDSTDFTITSTLPGTSRAHSTSLSAGTPRDGTLHHSVNSRAEDAVITITQVTAGGVRLSSVDWEGYEHRRARRA